MYLIVINSFLVFSYNFWQNSAFLSLPKTNFIYLFFISLFEFHFNCFTSYQIYHLFYFAEVTFIFYFYSLSIFVKLIWGRSFVKAQFVMSVNKIRSRYLNQSCLRLEDDRVGILFLCATLAMFVAYKWCLSWQ